MKQVTSLRWQPKSFPILPPSPENELATIDKQDTSVKIPEPGHESEASLWTAEIKKNFIRQEHRGTAVLCLHGPSLRLTQY